MNWIPRCSQDDIDYLTFTLALIGAWTVGRYLAENHNLRKYWAAPDDVRGLT